jgi:hypothetical protein
VDDSVTPPQKLYRQIAGIPPVLHYDIAVNYLGLIPGGTVTLAQLVSTRRFWLRAGLPGSQAYLAVPATGALALDLCRNGTSIGAVSFAAARTPGSSPLPPTCRCSRPIAWPWSALRPRTSLRRTSLSL